MHAASGIRRLCGVILAAGFGTRMKPITDTVPKPMIPVMGVPILKVLLKKLERSGAEAIHLNIHHLASSFSEEEYDAGVSLEFHPEEKILGTGGGIANMRGDLSGYQHILLHNADTISDIEYAPALEYHLRKKALFTMVLTPGGRRNLPPESVYLSGGGDVLGIGAVPAAETVACGYTGMAVIAREALDYFPAAGEKAGLVGILERMIERSPGSVAGYLPGQGAGSVRWGEIGTPRSYLELHRRIMVEKARFDPEIDPPPFPLHAGDGAKIGEGARWRGFLEVGPGAEIGKGSLLENCVVFPETAVSDGTEAENTIFYPGGAVKVGEE